MAKANDTEILKRTDDYKSWEKLILHCDALKELTDLEKERAKRAFSCLREELGEDFLTDAFNSRHPFCEYIINRAPWTRKWLTWFADGIKELKDKENYSSLLSRLRDTDKFREGLSVLEIGYKFSKAGFHLCIDPAVNVAGRTKVPDLKLTDKDSQEELFAEVSVLGQSKIDRDAFQTIQRIAETTWRSFPSLYHSGRIHKTLSKTHLNQVATRIEERVEKVKREGGFQELVIEDVIELGIAAKDDKEVLEKWAAERGLKVSEFCGPPYGVNEISRTKGRIRTEQKQLPRDHPTILVVNNHGLFLHARNVRKTISELEEEVYEYPHLLAVVVAGGYMGSGKDESTAINQHMFIKRCRSYYFIDQYIMLFNKFCKPKISASAITKIYDSFRSY